MSITPAIDAAIELFDDILDPEVSGHALPQDIRNRAYVAREMLDRQRRRQMRLWEQRECED